jgi:hypothetical protein
MSPALRIALAQTCPVIAPAGKNEKDQDHPFTVLETNLLDARSWVEKAVRERADVIVFPEYFLQGLVDDGRQVSGPIESALLAIRPEAHLCSTSRTPRTISQITSPALPRTTTSLLSAPSFTLSSLLILLPRLPHPSTICQHCPRNSQTRGQTLPNGSSS